jgi:colicin import membrane protein
MAERSSDRWVSFTLSVLLHGGLAAALVYGFWTYRQSRPPTPTLAIEATVVDSKSVSAALRNTPPAPQPPAPPPTPAPQPEPAPVPEEPTGPPEPTPEELAQREQAQREQVERDQAAAEKQRQIDDQKRQEQAQREADLEREQKQERLEADRKAAEAKKRAEEQQRLAEQKRAEDEQRKADLKAKAEREADLQSSLAAEEHANQLRNSGALASWESQITARIQRAWLRPPSARTGVECVLDVTQAQGGVVTNVRIGACNGDPAVRESIEAAVYRASPLPPPPDPSLFVRELEITFKPD